MTEAQRAHLHLMETLPRECIHTHEAQRRHISQGWRKDIFTGERKKAVQIPPAILKQRRVWMRRNAHKKTRYEICAALNMRHESVSRVLKRLGLTAKICARDARAAEIRQWLKRHAATHTIEEARQRFSITRHAVRYHLEQLGIACKAAHP